MPVRTFITWIGAGLVCGCAWQSPKDVSTYDNNFDACMAHSSSAQPGMTEHERRRECQKQLGPAPGAIPAKAPVAL